MNNKEQQKTPKQQPKSLNPQQKALFEILTSKIKYNANNYGEEDFKVDLVMRLGVPTDQDRYILKTKRPKIQQIFNNIPEHYVEAYQFASEYIDYLVQKNYEFQKQSNMYTRNITSLEPFEEINQSTSSRLQHPDQQNQEALPTPSVQTERALKLHEQNTRFFINKDLIDDAHEEVLQFSCQYKFTAMFDHFTLNYNMIMIILQDLCGLQVKSYILQDDDNKIGIYLLISSSLEKQKRLANLFELKKEIFMENIDFDLNLPTDPAMRPLQFNSKLNQLGWFSRFLRLIPRTLKTNISTLQEVIKQEHPLQEQEMNTYLCYMRELTESISEMIGQLRGKEVSLNEKTYLFQITNAKINKGSEQVLQEANLKRQTSAKIIELNKKYGYKYSEHAVNFEVFQLSSKKRPFFERLKRLLDYKYQKVSPYGQLALFNKMERIKLVFSLISAYFQFENYQRIGIKLQVFSLNDDFEKYGHSTSEHIIQDDELKKQSVFGGLDGKKLTDGWSMLLPFKSDLKCIRDYFGEVMTFNISAKIYLLMYIIILIPLSIASQFYLKLEILDVENNPRNLFIFHISQFSILLVSFAILIEVWKKHETKFIRFYENSNELTSYSEIYRGPYFRNLQTDNVNAFKTSDGILAFLYRKRWSLLILILIGLEFLLFYLIRLLLVANYEQFPTFGDSFQLLSFPHIICYGIFFAVNRVFSDFIFTKIVKFIVRRQNYATKAEEQNTTMEYLYFFEFGFEFVGPIYLNIIEPFQKLSCYNSECTQELQSYISSRYAIILIVILLNFRSIPKVFFLNRLILNQRTVQNEDAEWLVYYSVRFMKFLKNIQQEFEKQKVAADYLLDESVTLALFCLFLPFFPLCTFVSAGIFYLRYVLYRYEVLQSKRRTLAISQKLLKYSKVLLVIRRITFLINIWIIVFLNEIVQYQLNAILIVFVDYFDRNSILIFKVILVALVFILVEILVLILGLITQKILSSQQQNRSHNAFMKVRNNVNKSANEKFKKREVKPLVSVFRAYSNQILLEKEKQNKEMFEENKDQILKIQEKNKRILQSTKKKAILPTDQRSKLQLSVQSQNKRALSKESQKKENQRQKITSNKSHKSEQQLKISSIKSHKSQVEKGTSG